MKKKRMDPERFREIRKLLGYAKQKDFGVFLGYKEKKAANMISDFETGNRVIPYHLADRLGFILQIAEMEKKNASQ